MHNCKQQQIADGNVLIRWMIPRDHDEVAAVDEYATDSWGIDRIRATIRQRDVIGRVAECVLTQEVIGAQLVQFSSVQLHMVYLAVLPVARRYGVATRLINHSKDRITSESIFGDRHRIICDAPAKCIGLHQTLCANRFRVLSVDHVRDRYRFVWLNCFERTAENARTDAEARAGNHDR